MTADNALETLAAKLNSLELTDDEKEALGALLGVEPEVQGFAKRIYVGNLPVIQGFNIGMPPSSRAIGSTPRGLVADGIVGPKD